GDNKKHEILMKRKKVIGAITSKEYQKSSDNFKLKVITSDKQKFFFYSQQKHQGQSQEIAVAELSEFNLKKLQEQAGKKSESLEKRIICLKEQMIKTSNEEEVFLEYLEQFVNLLLIKHLSIKNRRESQLTEKEKKEQAILNKIVANWFYKT
ncbi:33928_t:CDS:2, partial [Racocetra persica]